MTKAFVLSAAMLVPLIVPAAQTSSPDTTRASAGAPTLAAPEAGSTTGSTTATTMLGSAARILTIDALEDMDLVGADGKEIGVPQQ